MNFKYIVLMVALGLLAACGGSASNTGFEPSEVLRSSKQRITSPDVSAQQLDGLVSGNTEFALRLLREIRVQEPGNVIYSPHSISIALAMTYAGARGITETEMATALNFGLPQNELHPAFNALDLALMSREDTEGVNGLPFQLRIANALWLQKSVDFQDPFLDVLALNYGVGVNLLDYSEDPEGARKEINAWAAYETEDKIKELIPEGAITPYTLVVLTNAIYFNASWTAQFDPNSTTDDSFMTPGGAVSAPTMHQMTDYGYFAGAGFEAVELPYDGNEVSMVVLLPEAGTGLAEFEGTLDGATLRAVFTGFENKVVDLSMPKFKFRSPLGLNQMLIDLGMPSAFDPLLADFTGFHPTLGLVITDVLHEAFIDVNEKGTEAAAATAVIIGDVSIPQADVIVDVDRPFLFLIRDRQTKAVIFIGRVVDPTK